MNLPPNAVMVYVDEKLRECRAEECYLWCWIGGPKWFYVDMEPVQGVRRKPSPMLRTGKGRVPESPGLKQA